MPDIPVQPVQAPELDAENVQLSVLRLDLVHPVVSGNKWFKLKYNLQQARAAGQQTLLSFGGPWSNHLHALAAAGRESGFCTVGVIRGELPTPLNPCLQDAVNAGMTLVPLSRAQYARKEEPAVIGPLRRRFGDFYLIPEGGANAAGMRGCAEIPTLYDEQQFDCVCLACGTGATLAGMALSSTIPLLGFQVLKGAGYLRRAVAAHLAGLGEARAAWDINEDYHFGGYARVSPELMQFLTEFRNRHGLPLEPVYSGKLLWGIFQAVKKRDFFPQNSRILAIHGGGLQGMRGFKKEYY